MVRFLNLIFIFPLLSSCQNTNEVVDSSLYATGMASSGLYMSYSESKEIYQYFSIKFDLPNNFYAKEISNEELIQLIKKVSFDPTFPTVMARMGSRDGYTYYMFKNSFESRKLFKIKNINESERDMNTLSSNSEEWDYVSPFINQYEFYDKNFIINWPLNE